MGKFSKKSIQLTVTALLYSWFALSPMLTRMLDMASSSFKIHAHAFFACPKNTVKWKFSLSFWIFGYISILDCCCLTFTCNFDNMRLWDLECNTCSCCLVWSHSKSSRQKIGMWPTDSLKSGEFHWCHWFLFILNLSFSYAGHEYLTSFTLLDHMRDSVASNLTSTVQWAVWILV